MSEDREMYRAVSDSVPLSDGMHSVEVELDPLTIEPLGNRPRRKLPQKVVSRRTVSFEFTADSEAEIDEAVVRWARIFNSERHVFNGVVIGKATVPSQRTNDHHPEQTAHHRPDAE